MGEALITRRGGGVKRGTIATVTKDTEGYYDETIGKRVYGFISDPNLINVRNAVIYLNNTIDDWSLSGTARILTLNIEDGQVAYVTIVWSDGDVNARTSGFFHYEPDSGTVYTSHNQYLFFLENNGFIPYDYIVFD